MIRDPRLPHVALTHECIGTQAQPSGIKAHLRKHARLHDSGERRLVLSLHLEEHTNFAGERHPVPVLTEQHMPVGTRIGVTAKEVHSPGGVMPWLRAAANMSSLRQLSTRMASRGTFAPSAMLRISARLSGANSAIAGS